MFSTELITILVASLLLTLNIMVFMKTEENEANFQQKYHGLE